jgi:hypothetical protein
MPHREPPARSPIEFLPAALCAAELGEPVDASIWPTSAAASLSAALGRLSDRVPYAAMCLLERLARSRRTALRVAVADTLARYADRYPERVACLLHQLKTDRARSVRLACTAATIALRRRPRN